MSVAPVVELFKVTRRMLSELWRALASILPPVGQRRETVAMLM